MLMALCGLDDGAKGFIDRTSNHAKKNSVRTQTETKIEACIGHTVRNAALLPIPHPREPDLTGGVAEAPRISHSVTERWPSARGAPPGLLVGT